MEDSVLNVDGAAQLLNVSRDTIYRLARDGTIPGRKVGSQWRFSEAVLMAWLRDGGATDDAPPTRGGATAAFDSPHDVDTLNGESMPEQSQPGSTISKG